jgi:hypothetical protein
MAADLELEAQLVAESGRHAPLTPVSHASEIGFRDRHR